MQSALRFLCLIALTATLLPGCNVDLPLPGDAAAQKIVLLGELSAGDSVLIRAGQSTPLVSGAPEPAIIQGLSLSLQEENGVASVLQGFEDYLSYQLFTMPYSSPQVIRAGANYTISGTHPTFGSVTASVPIPGPFTVKIAGAAFDTYNGDSVLRFDIDISDAAAAQRYFVVEAIRQEVSIHGYFYVDGLEYSITQYAHLYDSLKAVGYPIWERNDTSYSGMYSRQQLYTTDAASENPAGSASGRLYRRVFLPGRSFGGSPHRTQVMVPRASLYSEYGQHAQTTIHVKSVAPGYYDFLKSYEQYDPTMGLGGNTAQPKLEGNVRGGFGMIGGVSRWSHSIIF